MTNGVDQIDNIFRARLQEQGTRRRVTFRATPDIVENGNVNYKSIDPLHAPGGINVYVNTQSKSYNISNIRLISRTIEEATANLQRLNILRAWQKPNFGKKSLEQRERERRNQIDESQLLQEQRFNERLNNFSSGDSQLDVLFGNDRGISTKGAPPAILLFSAYADEERRGNIYKIPTVLGQLTINYPSDVDYIPSSTGVPVPTIQTVDLTLTESHSPREFERFSLEDYRNARLRGF